jgi:hypothetical protein
VFHDDRQGRVVAEIGAADAARQLHLSPGRYFVRGRGSTFLLEGQVTLVSGERRQVDDGLLERMEYARLVRKGRGPEATRGPQVGLRVRSPLAGGAGPCLGGFLGWGLDLRHVSLLARLGACRGERQSAALQERVDELDIELRAALVWDLPWLSVDLGVAGGGALFRQTFTTAGRAPGRRAGAAHVAATIGVQRDLGRGFYLQADLAGQTYFLRQQDSTVERKTSLISAFALRGALGAGRRW